MRGATGLPSTSTLLGCIWIATMQGFAGTTWLVLHVLRLCQIGYRVQLQLNRAFCALSVSFLRWAQYFFQRKLIWDADPLCPGSKLFHSWCCNYSSSVHHSFLDNAPPLPEWPQRSLRIKIIWFQHVQKTVGSGNIHVYFEKSNDPLMTSSDINDIQWSINHKWNRNHFIILSASYLELSRTTI